LSSACLECAARTTTEFDSSIVETDCLCQEGWYKTYLGGSAECKVCPEEGSNCKAGNVELRNGTGALLSRLPALKDYWRTRNTTDNLRLCGTSDVCIDHATGYSGAGCREGHVGPYCGTCAANYFLSSATKLCVSCDGPGSGDLVFVILAISIPILMLLFVCLFTVRSVRQYVAKHDDLGTNAANRASGTFDLAMTAVAEKLHMKRREKGCLSGARMRQVMVKLKIIISLVQVVKQMPDVYHIRVPPLFGEVMGVFSALDLDIPSVMGPLKCNMDYNYHVKVLLNTLVPLGFLLLLGAAIAYCLRHAYTAARPGSHEHVSSEMWRGYLTQISYVALLLLWFVYPSNSTYVFNTFNCENLDDGRSFLTMDYSIDCHKDSHRGMEGFAGFMIFIYPLGTPALFLFLLEYGTSRRHRLRRQTDADMHGLDHLWCLVEPYRPAVYWWEVAECMRKVVLVGLVVFTEPESVEQICIGLTFAMFSILVWGLVLPYRHMIDNFIMLTCQVQIFFVLLSGLVLRLQPTLDPGDAGRLDLLLLIFTIIPVVLAFAIVFETLAKELCEDRCDWIAALFEPAEIAETARKHKEEANEAKDAKKSALTSGVMDTTDVKLPDKEALAADAWVAAEEEEEEEADMPAPKPVQLEA